MSDRSRFDLGDINTLFGSDDVDMLFDGNDDLLNESYSRFELLEDGEDDLFNKAVEDNKKLSGDAVNAFKNGGDNEEFMEAISKTALIPRKLPLL